MGKSRNLRWRIQDGRLLGIMTQLPRLHDAALKGDICGCNIYCVSLTAIALTCEVKEEGGGGGGGGTMDILQKLREPPLGVHFAPQQQTYRLEQVGNLFLF